MTITDGAVERWVPEVDLPTRLRLVRREFGRARGESLTQEAMAELLGVQKATYQGWEAGTAAPRDIVATAKMLAEITGVDPSWLLGLPFGEVSGGSVRTGSRCTGSFPDAAPEWADPVEARLFIHDGPKRLRSLGRGGGAAVSPVAISLQPGVIRPFALDKYAVERDTAPALQAA